MNDQRTTKRINRAVERDTERFSTMDDPAAVKAQAEQPVAQGPLETGGIRYAMRDVVSAAQWQLRKVAWSDEATAFLNRFIADVRQWDRELAETKLLKEYP